ncbi:hypothetical protein Agabi119p4_7212 [Agaricus bisporus var. burnettii]|uniref:Uncharacterized protein n=1 Tax=Agaricus bisporus var. burnettii TaxID=192524 RepID=A0A8H7C8K1_AGABI|nr:hypothetical protein Agabi119p4_7212 [Agaricus bisporus var. burnettii]
MKFTTITPILSTILLSLSVTGTPVTMNTNTNIKVKGARDSSDNCIIPPDLKSDPTLVPEFGVKAGQNPTGTGDCDGIPDETGKPIKIPCSCPPDRDAFIRALEDNVALGYAIHNPSVAISFPTDGSNASKSARIYASIVTLQNFNGVGVGCPDSSTTLSAQWAAVS